MAKAYIVSTGDAFSGLQLCGPFAEHETANDYAEAEDIRPWDIVELCEPDPDTLANIDAAPWPSAPLPADRAGLIANALQSLRAARDALAAAQCPNACDAVRRAIKSTEGAARNERAQRSRDADRAHAGPIWHVPAGIIGANPHG